MSEIEEVKKPTIPKGELENFAKQEYEQVKTEEKNRNEQAALELSQIALDRLTALGISAEHMDANAPYVTADGLKFTGRHHYGENYRKSLHLVQRCKRCNKEMTSGEINSLSDLGRQLEQFTEDYPYHTCAKKQPPTLTLDEQLAENIRELVREEIGNNQGT